MELRKIVPYLKEKVMPYCDIIRFMLVLVACHLFWKYTLVYDEADMASTSILWFGMDVSAPFGWMVAHIAWAVYRILDLMGFDVSLVNGSHVVFANGHGVRIVWACSGLKQMYIFCCVLLCSRGRFVHKLWFIPFGLCICHLYNVVRITFLTWSVHDNYEVFGFYHEYVTKYIFYGIVFLLWVWWNERFNRLGNA